MSILLALPPAGLYSESYDSTLAHCNTTVWNPRGNGLSYEEFNFPIFSLKDDNGTEVIRQVGHDWSLVEHATVSTLNSESKLGYSCEAGKSTSQCHVAMSASILKA